MNWNWNMKNKTSIFLVIFVASLFVVPQIIFAAFYIPSSFDPGGKNNPFYFQEIQDYDATQRNANTQKENNLKGTYGLSNYYACYSENEASCGIKADTSNPSTQASCLTFIQYCLEKKAINSNRSDSELNNSCVRKYGEHWIFYKRDIDGAPLCKCESGYYGDQSSGTCISNDQACSNKFGQNWKWDGTKNDKGGLSCGCKDGYTLKNGTCIQPQIGYTETPNFLDEICQQSSGINSWYSGETDESKSGGIGGCGCKTGFRFEYGNYGKCIPVSQKTNDQSKNTTEPETSGSSDDVTKVLKELENLKNTISDLNTSDNQGASVKEKIKLENFVFNETKVKNFASKISTTLKMSAAFRDCPSKECAVIRYYVEGANVILIAGYDNNNWLKAEMRDDNGSLLVGWMHNSVLNKFEIPNKLKIKEISYQSSSLSNDTSTTTIEQKNTGRKSMWKRMKGFFGF